MWGARFWWQRSSAATEIDTVVVVLAIGKTDPVQDGAGRNPVVTAMAGVVVRGGLSGFASAVA